jgi:hypothetical protein
MGSITTSPSSLLPRSSLPLSGHRPPSDHGMETDEAAEEICLAPLVAPLSVAVRDVESARLGASTGEVNGCRMLRRPEPTYQLAKSVARSHSAIGLCDHDVNCGLNAAAKLSATVPESRTPGLKSPK